MIRAELKFTYRQVNEFLMSSYSYKYYMGFHLQTFGENYKDYVYDFQQYKYPLGKYNKLDKIIGKRKLLKYV